ncbi:DUF2884 family protein [Catenovulum sp. SM1970]|uniref:DUF2884 family protein n=1 Tax=Marinifaba aquimaris TaxID=2741323 RepID=UPI0015731F00|nr:DUF2884 family protein [Marinifaba aquimaris]NTS76494.1 DUF2884 family protein [Marinifaba aquimaris]
MKNSTFVMGCLALLNLLFSGSALAVLSDKSCQTDIQLGIIITDKHIRYLDNHRTKVQFNKPDQVIIKGEVLPLDERQRQLVKLYIKSMQQDMPQYIDLVMDGTMLVTEHVEQLAIGLHGRGSENHERIRGQLKHVVMRMAEKFNHRENHFYLGPQRIDDLREIIHRQVSNEIQKALLDSFNRFVSAVIDDTNTKDFKAKMRDFSSRMEKLSEDVFVELEKESGSLDQQSKAFCEKLIELDQLELRLQQNIPELESFNAIKHI